jgi:transcriptional regulator with GAF, ATPase, and Fis domain
MRPDGSDTARLGPAGTIVDMSVSHTSTVSNELGAARAVESRYLYQIINTVSSTLDLDRVLRAIVDLVSEAIDCHACWIYFVDPNDDGLVLRAVSDPYSALAGRLRFEPGEGLAGWVAEHNQAVFIPEPRSCRRPRRRSTSRCARRRCRPRPAT